MKMKLVLESWNKYLEEGNAEGGGWSQSRPERGADAPTAAERAVGAGGAASKFAQAGDAPISQYVPLLQKIAKHPEFRAIAGAGLTDKAGPADEVFKVEPGVVKASGLKATQAEIGFHNSLKDQVKNPSWKPTAAALGLNGEPIQMPCKPGPRCAILTFAGKYILDGHHRWSQVMMMNPNAEVDVDDLKATGALTSPEAALKLMQLAIALKAGKAVTADFEGKNLMASNEDEVAEYVRTEITPEVLQLMVKAGKIKSPDPELAAQYISGNLAAIQARKGTHSRGEVMPQAGKSGVTQDAVNDLLGTGQVNFDDPEASDIKKQVAESKRKPKNMKKLLNEWRNYVNEAESEKYDPETGTTPARAELGLKGPGHGYSGLPSEASAEEIEAYEEELGIGWSRRLANRDKPLWKKLLRMGESRKLAAARLTETIDKITNKVFKQLKEKKGRVTKSQLGQLIKEEIKASMEEGFVSRMRTGIGTPSAPMAAEIEKWKETIDNQENWVGQSDEAYDQSQRGVNLLKRHQALLWQIPDQMDDAYNEHGAVKAQVRQMDRLKTRAERAMKIFDERIKEYEAVVAKGEEEKSARSKRIEKGAKTAWTRWEE